MGRLVIVVFMLIISGIIYLVKAGAAKVTGNKNVNFQDESRKVMEKTARGVSWMNEQWENAKANSGGGLKTLPAGSSVMDVPATVLIARIKGDQNMDIASAEGAYIELAADKMDKRQFDDAVKLVMQLSEGEARDFMLREIEEKRNS